MWTLKPSSALSLRSAPQRGALVTAFVVAGVIAAGAPAAGAAPAPHAKADASPTVEYGIVKRACAPASPGDATCLAIGLVRVPKGTPGAVPFTVGNGYPTGKAGGYTPGDLVTAYGLSALSPTAGTGQTVAVVDAYDDPHALADLNTFDAYYGLPAETGSTFVKMNESGAASPLPSADTSGWSVEESLDVDAVRGICPNCKIDLVEANSTSFADLSAGVAAAVAAGATEVSNSYGGAEGTSAMSTSEKNALIADYNDPHVVITASTGDDGWYGWDGVNGGGSSDSSPEIPATLPDVVAVGGTSLKLNSDATRSSEDVWNEAGPEDSQFRAGGYSNASGGGCSLNFTAQPWQSSMPGFSKTGCGTSRLAADVSALADPYTGYDIYDSYKDGVKGDGAGWATYGGTSLASPLIAAMWALAGGAQGVSYPSLTLYGNASSGSSPFYDVTGGYDATGGVVATGGNDWCDGDIASTCASNTSAAKGSSNPNGLGDGMLSCVFNAAGTALANDTQCTAAAGFDGPSGVGTPNGIGGFAPLKPTPSYTAPTGVNPGVSTAFSGSATDPFPGGAVSSYSWSWGDGTGNTSGANASHTFAAAGNYTVTLSATDSYGQTGSVSHTVVVGTVVAPTVTSISPTSGPAAGGTSVTINGTGFSGATAVKFGTTNAPGFTVVNATKITVNSPAHSAGAVDVTVTTPSGTSATSGSDQFTYLAAPTVTSVSPTSGAAAGGTSVTINGTGFTGVTAVKFGTTNAPGFAFVNDTRITVNSPAHSAGAVDVTVTTPNGTSATSASDQFNYLPAPPTVTSISPTSGPAAGGTSVTINGTGFTGATAVEFGTSEATGYTINTATKITATSPAHAGGVVDVTVTTPSGTSATSPSDQFTFASAPGPTVTAVAPSTGPAAGGTVVKLTGTGFTGATAVHFGTVAATGLSVKSATKITVTSPAGTGVVDVTVTTPAGTSATSGADHFTYTSTLKVTGISPATGPAAGGTTVTITGAGFTGVTGVTFGGLPATGVVFHSDSSITAVSPASTGSVAVQVTTPAGTSPPVAADKFKYTRKGAAVVMSQAGGQALIARLRRRTAG